jgi:transcriptional regulator
MYIPQHFREDRAEVLHAFIREHTLATVVTLTADGLMANHIPMILDPAAAPLGVLRGHISRANPQWRESLVETEALAIFQGPSAYISPSWYKTKDETGRVVPTYNFVVVHARGRFRAFDDAVDLERNVRELTEHHEAAFPRQWSVDDAPADFIRSQLKGIVGVEIVISGLEGKWKVSQNRPVADRAGVVEALRADGDSGHALMAECILGNKI